MVFVIDFSGPPSHRQLYVVHVFEGAAITFENSVLGPAVAILHYVSTLTKFRVNVLQNRGYRLHVRQVFHGQAVLEAQFLTLAHFLCGSAKLERLNMESENHVRSQAADDLPHIVIQPAHDR